MSLQIKFPFGKSHGPLHTCSACGYCTRQRALFERHIEGHQENKDVSDADSEDTPLSEIVDLGSSETDADQSVLGNAETRPALVNRNYRCKTCDFTTNRSRLYLYHERDVHGAKILVFPCDLCDYVSRYKCKVLRHRKLRHREAKEVDIVPEQEDVIVNTSLESAVEMDPRSQALSAIYVKQPAKSVLKPSTPKRVLTNNVPSTSSDITSDALDVDMNTAEDSGTNEPGAQSMESSTPPRLGAIEQGTIIKSTSPQPESPRTPKPTENAFLYISKVIDSPEPMFQCALCTYSNGQKWKVANHIRSFHMKKKLFRCPYCPFVTGRKIEFCIHKTKHSDKKVYECEECSYRTTMRTNFDRHVANHQGTGPIKCTICSYSSTGEAAVQRHMQEYHPKTDISVPLEGDIPVMESASSAVPVSLSLESPTMVPRRIISPSLKHDLKSENGSPPSSPLNKSSSDGVSCQVCGMYCRTESKLRIHMVAHSTESSHGCPLCSLKYKRMSDLNRHMKRKHNTRLKDFYAGTLLQDEPLNLCVKSEPSQEAGDDYDKPLDLSMKPPNLVPQENLKCSLCSYLAKWPSDLRRHLLVHSVEKRFKCIYCHRRYKYQFDLNMHIRRMHKMPAGRSKVLASSSQPPVGIGTVTVSHGPSKSVAMPSRPTGHKRKQLMPMKRNTIRQKFLAQVSPVDFRCKFCPYVGKCRSEIERHQRVHTGEKPYACLFCTYRSPWKGDMKRHIQKHHAQQVENNDIQAIMLKTYQPETARPATPEPAPVSPATKEERMTADDEEYRAQLYGIPQSHSPKPQSVDSTVEKGGMKLPVAVTPDKEPESRDKTKNFCPYCPFICEAPSKLKCHMEIHENLKRYKCSYCGKRSNWTWDVRKHIKKDHPNMDLDVITLSEEEARYTLDDYLKHHAKSPLKAGPIGKRGSHHVPLSMVEMRMPLAAEPPSLINLFSTQEGENSGTESLPEKTTGRSDSRKTAPATSSSSGTPFVGSRGKFKPFKCSRCGKRSNWKWDTKKHIQNVHHGNGRLIILSLEEAKSTLDAPADTGDESPSIKATSHLPEIKNSPSPKAGSENGKSKPSHHQVDLKSLKKFKCSLCPYRSNFRSDIGRHAKRLHYRMSFKVMVLSDEEAAASLKEYKDKWARKKFVYSPEKLKSESKKAMKKELSDDGEQEMDNLMSNTEEHEVKEEVDMDMPFEETDSINQKEDEGENMDQKEDSLNDSEEQDVSEEEVDTKEVTENTESLKSQPSSNGRVWKCRSCSFQNPNKVIAFKHLKTHPHQKPFRCKICSDMMNYRNSMHRHIRVVHDSLDYLNVVEEMVYFQDDTRCQGNKGDVFYRCKLCGQTSRVRWGIIKHGRDKHPKLNAKRLKTIVQKVEPLEAVIPQGPKEQPKIISQEPKEQPKIIQQEPKEQPKKQIEVDDNVKKIKCNICPYRTNKTGLLKIHKSYHKPQPGNKFKCKYCPYYVSAMRLLHQHYRLHTGENEVKKEVKELSASDPVGDPGKTQNTSPVKNNSTVTGKIGGKRYMCDQCPYMSRNKNDYMYHKQFHRPKPTAEFKCSLCNYWVGQPRLLRQHERVHTLTYQEENGRNTEAPETELLTSVVPSDVESSPAKSDISDYSSDDAVEIAQIKQQIIASKITSVPITPEKFKEQEEEADSPSKAFQEPSDPLLMKGFLVNRKGYLMKSGAMRKAHKCRYCPYTNIRATNLRLHEQMHSPRKGKDLMKCPYCDYYVGNKGLLAHHVKVHSYQYRPGQDEINDVEMEEGEKEESEQGDGEESCGTKEGEGSPLNHAPKATISENMKINCGVKLDACDLPKNAEYYVKYNDETGEHVLERARIKKWCCEKCPYATMKKSQFERHVLLHGSKQKYTCEFCDYSVPAYHLLLQHKKLHLMPNPNLLNVQSISNLQKLPEVPADVAAVSDFPASKDDPVSQLGTHDHMELYENTIEFVEPKKLYRCDRCPYTNVRRDHLLTHLKFHMLQSERACPYCDYSVSKHHLLVQHIKVHFTAPGDEGCAYSVPSKSLDDASVSSEEKEDLKSESYPIPDITQPEYIDISELGNHIKTGPLNNNNIADVKSCEPIMNMNGDVSGKANAGGKECDDTMWICQYCDRSFGASEKLLRHEMQHLVGTLV